MSGTVTEEILVTGTFRDEATAGAQAATDALGRLGEAMDVVEERATRVGKTASALSAALTETGAKAAATQRIQADLARTLEDIATQVDRGALSQQQASEMTATAQGKAAIATEAAVARVTKSFAGLRASGDDANEAARRMGAGVGVSSYQLQILGDQAHKAFDQIAAGGGVLKALAYQVPNMANTLGGFGNAVSMVGGFMAGPGGLVVAAGAAVVGMGALAYEADRNQAALLGLGNRLRATRDDYTAMAATATETARQLARTPGIGAGEARTAVESFSAVPTVDGSQLSGLVGTARDLAAVLGQTVPQASQQMVEAMRNPEKAAEDFAQRGLLGVNEQLAQHIKALQDSGQASAAWTLLLGQMQKASLDAAEQGITPLEKAMDRLGKSTEGVFDRLKRIGADFGTKVANGAASSIDLIERFYKYDTAEDPRGDPRFAKSPIASISSSSTDAGLSAVNAKIDYIAKTLNAPADVAALAHRIAPIESATGQYGANGAVVRSSMGALGAMQVMPGNAGDNDLSTLTGNVTAGEQLLIRLYGKYHADQRLVAMAYNWGEGNVDKYLSGNAAVPSSVQDYARRATGGVSYSPTVLAGKQGTVDAALRTPDSSITGQRETENRAIAQISAAQQELNRLRAAGKVSDADYADENTKLTLRLQDHQKTLLNLLDPMQQLKRQQDQAAQSANVFSGAQLAMVQAMQQANAAARAMGQAHASTAQILDAQARAQAALTGQFNDGIAATNRQTAAQQQLLAGLDGTQKSFLEASLAMKSAEDVRKTAVPGTDEYTRQLGIRVNAERAAAASSADLATVQKTFDLRDQIAMLRAETDSLGMNEATRDKSLAAIQAEQDLRKRGADLNSSASRAYLAETAQLADLTAAYKQQQDALAEVGAFGERAFGDITQAITAATVAGKGQAVSFGSVWSGVMSEARSEFLKLAVLNPLQSTITGRALPSLQTVAGLSTGAGGGLGGVGALVGGVGAVAGVDSDPWGGAGTTSWAATSASPVAVAASSPGGMSGLSSLSGLLSVGKSLLGGTASTGFSAVDSVLNTSVVPSNLGGLGGAGASVGNLAGGIGGGYMIGSTVGSFVAGSNAVRQQNAEIGAAGGAIAGAAIGSIIPGVGTVIGGLVGGALGGGGGGLIGGTQHKYSNIQIDLSSGRLSVGDSIAQAVDNSEQLKSAYSDVDAVNQILEKYNLGARSSTGASSSNAIVNVGGNVKGLGQVQSIGEALSALHIQSFDPSADPRLNAALSNPNNVNSLDKLGKLADLFGSTIPDLIKSANTPKSDYDTQMKALSDSYGGAIGLAQGTFGVSGLDDLRSAWQSQIDKLTAAGTAAAQISIKQNMIAAMTASGDPSQKGGAQVMAFDISAQQQKDQLDAQLVNELGAAVKGTSLYSDAMNSLSQSLGTQRDALTQQIQAQQAAIAQQVNFTDRGLWSRDVAAKGDSVTAGLMNFDLSADQQRQQLSDQLTSAFGSAYKQTSDYATQMGLLNTVLGDERTAQADALTRQRAATLAAVSDSDANLRARDLTARGDPVTAGLMTFDIQADQQRRQLTDQLVSAFGVAYQQTSDYAGHMALLNQVLGDERTAQVAALNAQHDSAVRAVLDNDASVEARRLAATGQSQNADLLNQATQARDEQAQLTQTLVNTFGIAYQQTAEYAARMTALETTQQAERAAIAKKYTDAAAQAANGAVSGLSSYVSGLLTGAASPLSAREQYLLAQRQFGDVAARAGAGDYTALGQLQGYAETYRTDAQAVYGSGKGYADTVSQIAQAIGGVAGMGTDALTASYQASLVQDQTATLVSSLSALQSEVAQLRAEVAQQTRMAAVS